MVAPAVVVDAVDLWDAAAAVVESPDLGDAVRALRDRLADPTPRVAVIGPSSAGKTTLIHRLVDAPYLPIGRDATTAAVTLVRYGDRPRGELRLHTRVRVDLDSADPVRPDTVVRAALLAWTGDPDLHHPTAVAEVTGGRRQPVELADLHRRLTADPDARGVFEVEFRPAPVLRYDVTDPVGARYFTAALRDAALAMRVASATCLLPHPRLRQFSLVDTAGFASPHRFHSAVSHRLLEEQPDVVIVLLDARHLDSAPNHGALAAVRGLVTDPGDHRRLVIGLTHWDKALRSHIHDEDLDIDYADPAQRAVLTAQLLAGSTAQVGDMLGITPVVFPLALGARSPADLKRHEDALWDHVAAIDTAELRARTARNALAPLRERFAAALADLRDRHRRTAKDRAAARDRERIAARRGETLDRVAPAAAAAVRGAIVSSRTLLLAKIGTLDSAKQVRGFLSARYQEAVEAAVADIAAVAREQFEALSRLLGPDLREPPPLDAAVLGADPATAKAVGRPIRRARHGFNRAWNVALGSVWDRAGRDVAAARRMLEVHAYHRFSDVGRYLDEWIRHVHELHGAEKTRIAAALAAARAEADRLAATEKDLAARIATVEAAR